MIVKINHFSDSRLNQSHYMIVPLVLVNPGKEFEVSLGPSVLVDRSDHVDTLFVVNVAHVKGLKWLGVFGIKVVNVYGLRSDNSVDQVLVATEEVLSFLLHDEQ